MKTKHTKIDRSAAKWLPGALALSATTASSQAATVQITLAGNKISSIGGDQLNADLTGDGVNDLMPLTGNLLSNGVYVRLSGGEGLGAVCASGTEFGVNGFVDASFGNGRGSGGAGVGFGVPPLSRSYLNPVTFSDTRINGGVATEGWLQVDAWSASGLEHTVELSRLIFDDASTTRPGFTSIPGVQTEWVAAVPEPGSNLALLVLGANGLTLRRRLNRAA